VSAVCLNWRTTRSVISVYKFLVPVTLVELKYPTIKCFLLSDGIYLSNLMRVETVNIIQMLFFPHDLFYYPLDNFYLSMNAPALQ